MAEETSRRHQEEPNWVTRFVPLLGWAPQYERRWLRPDLIAGLTVTALVVPKALGYAGIAGVPIQYGLYAAAAGRDLVRAFWDVAPDLDRTELCVGGRCRQRGPCSPACPAAMTRWPWWRRSPW